MGAGGEKNYARENVREHENLLQRRRQRKKNHVKKKNP